MERNLSLVGNSHRMKSCWTLRLLKKLMKSGMIFIKQYAFLYAVNPRSCADQIGDPIGLVHHKQHAQHDQQHDHF